MKDYGSATEVLSKVWTRKLCSVFSFIKGKFKKKKKEFHSYGGYMMY